MKRLVIGTAGHIDHGKTRLVEALTGIDCDRLAEEKARGITIDLGFAHLEADGVLLAFVDVPGHEKFLHNALAGLGGIGLMMLVVAADEGVMPQTREHLAVCSLLRIPRALVVLTKCDLVDSDGLELAQLEIEELLENTIFAGAPILAVSSKTLSGIPELRRTLVEMAQSSAHSDSPSRPLRLPIDRVFQLRGLGAVVTGTLAGGRIKVGETVEIQPRHLSAKVRSVQAHGQDRDQAVAGERAAIQLAGVELSDLERGDQLVAPGSVASTRSLAATLTLLPDAEPFRTFREIRFHLFSSEVHGRMRPLLGEIAPGESGAVEIRLARPVVARRGDLFVVRRPSPAATIGGGVILDPLWRRRRAAVLTEALESLRSEDKALELFVAEPGERGQTAERLAPRLGLTVAQASERLEALAKAHRVIVAEVHGRRHFLDPRIVARVGVRAKELLKAYFQENRLARGMAKAELATRLLPRKAQDLLPAFLTWLQAQKILVLDGDLVNLPGRAARSEMTLEESSLAQKVLELFETGGLTPPSPGGVVAELSAKSQIVEGMLKFLVQQRKLVRLPDGLMLATSAFNRLREDLVATGWQRFSVPQFKEHFGLSRKWAIPLLEQLDSVGATRRVGDERLVVRRADPQGVRND